jgi:Flp pilus assembly protein protease CpaA
MAATVIATITDLRERLIYRRLTVSLLISGLIYSGLPYHAYLTQISFNLKGAYVLWLILQTWLGPIVIVTIFMVFLFWLGILGGGDGHFLIAITPWMGALNMAKLTKYLFPLILLYLILYLIYMYKLDIRKLAQDQLVNIIILYKHIPTVTSNIASGDPGVLEKNIPYVQETNIEKPPAMPAILVAIVLTFLI